jgi:Ca2+-binding RTX toxin-like protein
VNGLSFSLVGAPSGAAIDADTGLFSWTPGEDQDGEHTFTVRVTDDGTPELSDEQQITVTVNEVNLAPQLDAIGDQTISEGALFSLTIDATDADVPANTLMFSASGLPEGASFDPTTRMFSWMPSEVQGPSDYAVTFVVTDNGAGALSDEATITITVNEDASLNAGPQANDGNPDTFRLVRSSNGEDLEGYLNDGLVFVRGFADVTDLAVTGSADDDTLIVDLSFGDPIPAGGISFDGGGPGDNDALALTGGTVETLIYTVLDESSGTVSVDGKLISYTGLEPIMDDLVVASRVFVFGGGNDTITVDVGATRTTVDSPTSESVQFVNPTGMVTILGGDGDDSIVVTGSPPYALQVDAGGGNNTVTSSVPVSGLITGTSGADVIVVSESGGVVGIDVNGTASTLAGASSLLIDALGGPDTVTLSGLTIPVTVKGGAGDDRIDASGVSAIGVVLLGGDGNDLLIGGDAADTLLGEADDDVLSGNGGADILDGGAGFDTAILSGIMPIAYWNLNETAGSSVADSAGVPQDGTFYGSNPDLDDQGPPLSAAPFDAQTSADFHDSRRAYIAVAHDPAFEVAQGAIQLWFNTRDANDDQVLFAKDHNGRSNGLRIRLDNRDLRVEFEGGGSTHVIDTRNTAFNNLIRSNTWYQLTFAFGPDGMKLYVDGVLVGSNSYGGGLVGNREAIVIGGSNQGNRDNSGDPARLAISKPFDGHIDEVAFYDVALTSQQIAQTRERGALGIVSPQDAGDTLANIEHLEYSNAPTVFTAAVGASNEIEIASQDEAGGGWSGRWPDLAQLLSGVKHHGLSELVGELKAQGLKLFGHTSGKPALFSVEGIKLAKDGRATLHAAEKTLQGLDGWSRETKKRDSAPANENREKAPPAKHAKEAKDSKQGEKSIDWTASFHGLGAALTPAKLNGARGAAQPNLAAFDKQPSNSKKRSAR